MGRKVVTLLLVVAASGCSFTGGEALFAGEDEGRFLLSADRAGMEAFGEALNGIKNPAGQDQVYWDTRKVGITARTYKLAYAQKPKEK